MYFVKKHENIEKRTLQDESFILLNTKEDHEIIRRVLNESVDAYGLLIKKYQVPVYNLFLRMLHDRYEAEELTQETFIKAYEALHSFRFEYRFFSWLYRIAVNLALNNLKKQRKFVGIEHLKNFSNETNEKNIESDAYLRIAVDQLKERFRTVVVLKYYQQLSYKEISFALDITEKKVRSRLYDARIQLKVILEKMGYN